MSIKASTKYEAFRFLDRKNVLKENREYSDKAGYPVYFPYGDSTIDYRVNDLGCRLEVLIHGETQNIWIENIENCTSIIVGIILENKIFSDVTINNVKEVNCYNVVGFTYQFLDDGELGILIHFLDGDFVSLHTDSIAYIKIK